jgi:hypothetical protein
MGAAGTGPNCDTNANICLNSATVSGVGIGTYNVDFCATDAAQNTACTEAPVTTEDCCFQVQVTESGSDDH